MTDRIGVWLVVAMGWSVLLAGCSGTAQDSDGTDAGSGPAVCTGELNTVAAAWWLECPSKYCAALAWVQGCQSLPSRPTARAGDCQDLKVVTLEYGTHSKECYYSASTGSESSELVGAAATDDTPSYCAQSSHRIEAGTTAACVPAIVCDDTSETPESNESGC